MDDVTMRRAGGLPAHLRSRAGVTPGGEPIAEEDLTTLTSASESLRIARLAATQPGEEMFPCPCGCGCGNLTSMPVRKIARSRTMQMLLRCEDCALKGGVHAAGSPVSTIVPQPRVLRRNPIDAELDAQADAEQERIHFEEQWALWQAGVPEKFRNAELDARVDPDNKEAIKQRLRLMRDGDPCGAIIYGLVGSGKSWLAYSFANMAIKYKLLKRGEVKHGTEVELLGNIAVAPWNERARLLKDLLSPRLKMLVIDDVGREMRTKPAERRALYDEIANMAWANGRALVITTNLKPEMPSAPEGQTVPDEIADGYLAGWVGEAAYSRIRTSCGDAPIVVPDRQMRDKLFQEKLERGGR